MKITNITIGGNPIVEILSNTFNYTDRMNERTTVSFSVVEPDFEIDVGMEVLIATDDGLVFGGTIDNMLLDDDYANIIPITCVDFSQRIDRRMVIEAYEDRTAGYIVRDLIDQVFSQEGIEVGVIEDGPIVSKATLRYMDGNEAMNAVSDITGFMWEIDKFKKLNFMQRSANLSPVSFTEENANYRNFKVQKKRGKYRNRQYTQAGLTPTVELPEERPTPAPDGVSQSFIMRLPLAGKPRIFINGIEVNPNDVGVNGLDRDKKWYFSYNSNVIAQDTQEDPLVSGDILLVLYRGLYPIFVFGENVPQIEQRQAIEGGTGLYEAVEEANDLRNENAALEFTFGKLDKYGLIPQIVTFDTNETNVKAGQIAYIKNEAKGIDDNFLIESVSARGNSDNMVYSVRALDGANLGGWEQFFKELLRGSRKLTIREDEAIIRVIDLAEVTGWRESLQSIIFSCPIPNEELYPGTEYVRLEESRLGDWQQGQLTNVQANHNDLTLSPGAMSGERVAPPLNLSVVGVLQTSVVRFYGEGVRVYIGKTTTDTTEPTDWVEVTSGGVVPFYNAGQPTGSDWLWIKQVLNGESAKLTYIEVELAGQDVIIPC